MPALKTIDQKGRLTLGREFAGRTVQVEKNDAGIVIKFYRMVPDREAWLWENETARDLVERGIAAAASGALTDGPTDLAASFKFAERIPEE